MAEGRWWLLCALRGLEKVEGADADGGGLWCGLRASWACAMAAVSVDDDDENDEEGGEDDGRSEESGGEDQVKYEFQSEPCSFRHRRLLLIRSFQSISSFLLFVTTTIFVYFILLLPIL